MAENRDEEKIQTASNTQSDAAKLSQFRNWVVKANSEIIGPFSFEEVSQQLRENRLVPHDEIISPGGRWQYIKQEEMFRGVINEIKNRQSASEKTSDLTASGGLTASGTFTDPSAFDNTSELMDKIEGRSLPTEVQLAASSRDLAKTYGSENDPRVQQKVFKEEKFKILLVLFIFAAAGIFYFFKFSPQFADQSQHQLTFQELLNRGTDAEKVGDYQKATGYYSDARNLRPNDNDLLIRIAPLALTFDRQVLQAGRIFKQVLDSDTNPEHKKSALIGLGLVAMEGHDFDQGLDYFNKVISLDATNPAAMVNMGLINFYRDRYEEAINSMHSGLDRGGSDGAVVISLVDASLALFQEKGVKENLVRSSEMLNQYISLTYDYRIQALIELAYVKALLGQPNEATQSLEHALDTDPEQTDLFLRDWRIFRERANWEQSLATLKRLNAIIGGGPRVGALRGLLMFLGREKIEGEKEVDKALAQSPKDPLILALAGWINLKLGHREQAVGNIKEAASVSGKYSMPKIMSARLCVEESNYDCALKIWEGLVQSDQKSITAYHGLAQAAWSKKDRASAIRWLREGQAMEPKYIPFNILSAEIENSESEK